MTALAADAQWWREAVVYQIYIRSFADGNGDGEGDIAGIRQRLPYLRDLGVDAVWINPWYPSPMIDGGYDVADYRDVDARFGSLAQAKTLIEEVHRHDMRIVLDLVPNHSSWDHPWFRAALASGPGSAERGRYLFRDGTGPRGDLPPNNWTGGFGSTRWERVTESDGKPGQWYFHMFDRSQPDFNWAHPEVRQEFLDVFRFWFDLNVDGFRIDVAHGMEKDIDAPDLPYDADGQLLTGDFGGDHPFLDRDGVHEIFREWRKLADSYERPRMLVAEAWVASQERLARYVRADELHGAFNFEFLEAPWRPAALRDVIVRSLAALDATGAAPTWVLENHDVQRVVTRYGRSDDGGPVDVTAGRCRARAAALLMLALPGAAYLYQGQELGLPEVLDLPQSSLQDPIWTNSGHTERGRDGCRVPIPWESGGVGSGRSWLPQPAWWGDLSVCAQSADSTSVLSLYREALRLRREHLPPASTGLQWLDVGQAGVLAFARPRGIVCVVNLGTTPVRLNDADAILVASEPITDLLPPDTAVWLTWRSEMPPI